MLGLLKGHSSHLDFPFGPFRTTEGPQLEAKRATVASQLWPFCKLVWPISGLFSAPKSCQ